MDLCPPPLHWRLSFVWVTNLQPRRGAPGADLAMDWTVGLGVEDAGKAGSERSAATGESVTREQVVIGSWQDSSKSNFTRLQKKSENPYKYLLTFLQTTHKRTKERTRTHTHKRTHAYAHAHHHSCTHTCMHSLTLSLAHSLTRGTPRIHTHTVLTSRKTHVPLQQKCKHS